MDDTDGEHRTPDRRAYHAADGADINVRQPEDEDGVFEIRMPIASTGEVRNENDDPLTRDELQGMAQQVGDGVVSVFPDHGQTPIGGMNRYSIAEKAGEWNGAEVVGEQDSTSDAAELVATARLMDPDTLPDIPIRKMLGTIKELVNRDMSVQSSIGWRDDDGSPGGVDLMEASIVGIPADPRTTSQSETAVVARAAVEAGADPEALVDTVRAAVEGERPLGPPEDPDRFDTFDECVAALQEDDDLSEEEAERICGSWEAQKDEQSHDMTDEDTESDTEADTEQDEQPDESRQDEMLERLVELQEQQMDTLEAIEQSVRQEDEDDEMEDDEDEEQATDEDDDEEDEDEMSADEPDESQDAELREELAELKEELAAVRSGDADVETPGPDEEQNDEPTNTQTEPTEDNWRQYA